MGLDAEAMKNLVAGLLLLLTSILVLGQSQTSSVPQATNAAPEQAAERLAADTPKTTVFGNAFVAPKDWSIRVNGPATILTAPEGGSWVALVDVQATGPDEALTAAWKAYKLDAKWPIKVTYDLSDQDGWSRRRVYEYRTSPNEKRGVAALVSYSGSNWNVVIEDLADAVAEKRGAQVALVPLSVPLVYYFVRQWRRGVYRMPAPPLPSGASVALDPSPAKPLNRLLGKEKTVG